MGGNSRGGNVARGGGSRGRAAIRRGNIAGGWTKHRSAQNQAGSAADGGSTSRPATKRQRSSNGQHQTRPKRKKDNADAALNTNNAGDEGETEPVEPESESYWAPKGKRNPNIVAVKYKHLFRAIRIGSTHATVDLVELRKLLEQKEAEVGVGPEDSSSLVSESLPPSTVNSTGLDMQALIDTVKGLEEAVKHLRDGQVGKPGVRRSRSDGSSRSPRGGSDKKPSPNE